MDCPICCLSFTTFSRKAVKCNACEYEVCVICVKKYLLSTTQDPHCLKCKGSWSREFLDDILPQTFRDGDLKKHRENVLVDREKSMLPATIPLVEAEINQRKIKQNIKELTKEKNDLLAQVAAIEKEIYQLNRLTINPSPTPQSEERRIFQRPCPSNDCRGFLSGWKCSLCNVHVCNECHVIKSDDTHECKEDDIATAKLLAKDTRNCPNDSCKAPIFKIEGCNQMFCTKCHTAFDWRTGEIVRNQAAIHNPHYYDWLRQQNNGIIPRNVGDVPCGGLPGYWTISSTLERKKIKVDYNTLSKYHRGILHIIHVEIPRHRILIGNEEFAKLRVKYLMKELSEEEWKRNLQKAEKKNEKSIAYRHVFDMLTSVSIDMFNRIVNASTANDVETALIESDQLRKYFNTTMMKLAKRFGSKSIKTLNNDWLYAVHKE